MDTGIYEEKVRQRFCISPPAAAKNNKQRRKHVGKRIIFTVTNDLSQDQRMNRICTTLCKAGYHVTLVGRKLRSSRPLHSQLFFQKRLFCVFTAGKLFYVEYNIRLFFYLLFKKFDILSGIDLDTILPAYIVSKIRNRPFVYDAHEYFTQMEEVVSRPLIQKAWERLEGLIVPRLKYAYTVSEGYVELFEKKYHVKFELIRNVTVLNERNSPADIRDNEVRNPPSGKSYILYQGSVNVGRGLENLVEAMQKIDCRLYVCGKGDILGDLKALSKKLGLEDKISFFGFVQPEKLKEYTENASVGITLFSNIGLSNHFSLANRFFDYLHSGVPQVAMSYPEYKNFNSKNEVALLVDDLNTETIVSAVNRLLNDSEYYNMLRRNCMVARKEFNWQNEEKKLLDFYSRIA